MSANTQASQQSFDQQKNSKIRDQTPERPLQNANKAGIASQQQPAPRSWETPEDNESWNNIDANKDQNLKNEPYSKSRTQGR